MRIASPHPSLLQASKAHSKLTLTINRLIRPADADLRATAPEPTNWHFILGVSLMLLLSAICWVGFAEVLAHWF